MSREMRAACEQAHFQDIDALQAAVFSDSRCVFSEAFGAADTSAIFDVASVTKMASTTLTACVLHARGLLNLESTVGHFIPSLKTSHAGIQVRHLLAHSSGLPAWKPFFQEALTIPGAFPGPPSPSGISAARERCLASVFGTPPVHPPGAQRIYSDTGFILLGEILSIAGSAPLDELASRLVFEPAGLQSTRFHRLGDPIETKFVIPTGSTRPRSPAPGQEGLFSELEQASRLDPGEVDDDNAYALGGVAGHAGLFSTASDLGKLGALIIEEYFGADHLGAGDSLRLFAQVDAGPTGPPRSLGFDQIAAEGSSVGERWGKGTLGGFGHLGFTGCALWIDLDRKLSGALLTNRVLHGREHTASIRSLRPQFYDGVITAYQSGHWLD